jgi:N-acetylglucosaminyldiphosphoundecaprenol N-acetyl-beta-D-mannosaminyltransferase
MQDQDRTRGEATDGLNLLGLRISAVNLPAAVARIEQAIARKQKGYICVRDVHGVIRCQKDAELRKLHNRAFLVTPDGMPLVWALWLSGRREADRVYGPDLMFELLSHGREVGLKHFLYGTTPEVLEKLQGNLARKLPGVEFVGAYSPPFRELTEAEQDQVVDMLNRSGADIVWVGLSTPKQELWMGRMRDRLTSPMLIGVGAAFDFHASVKRQAPRFVQRSGFEWLYRLACEPRRLGMRYAVAIPSFLWLALTQATGLRRFPVDR